MPTAKGTLTIPPVSLEVFDPVEKRVVTKTTQPIVVTADAGAETTSADAAAAAPTGAAETILPPPPPAPGAAAAQAPTPAHASVDLSRGTVTVPLWALGAIAAVALATGGAFVVARRRRTRGAFRQALVPEPGETKERAAARVDRALREVLARRHGVAETLGARGDPRGPEGPRPARGPHRRGEGGLRRRGLPALRAPAGRVRHPHSRGARPRRARSSAPRLRARGTGAGPAA